MSQIEGRCSDLEIMTGEINSLASTLRLRLESVLVPEMKGESGNKATPAPVVSPLAQRLDSVHGGLTFAAGSLRDLIERLAI